MGTVWSEGTAQFVSRAPRFPIQTSLRFRIRDEKQWQQAETVNISRTGILFRAREWVPVMTPMEMRFELPVEISDGVASVVVCQGEVVRTVLPAASDESPALAASIRDYRFVRRPAGHVV